jgi:tetratricopeptide (TPR) repeat protein
LDDDIKKLLLLYEFNKSSPLFARIADYYLNNGNFDEALTFMDKGLENHPNYFTARIIYAKALACIGKVDLAKKEIDNAFLLNNSIENKDTYYRQMEKISSDTIRVSDSRRVSFFEGSIENEDSSNESSFEDNLEELAKKLEGAKIKGVDGIETETEENPGIVFTKKPVASETLAGIYLAQGNLEEAKNVYLELKKKNPDKADYYNEKIAEIDNSLKQ